MQLEIGLFGSMIYREKKIWCCSIYVQFPRAKSNTKKTNSWTISSSKVMQPGPQDPILQGMVRLS